MLKNLTTNNTVWESVKKKKIGLILGGLAGIALGTGIFNNYSSKQDQLYREIPRVRELQMVNRDLYAMTSSFRTPHAIIERYKTDPEFAKKYDALYEQYAILRNSPEIDNAYRRLSSHNVVFLVSGAVVSTGLMPLILGLFAMVPEKRLKLQERKA